MYVGKCVGGPYSGEEYAYFSPTMIVVEPAIRGADLLCRDPDELKITAVPMGQYEHSEIGFWIWRGLFAGYSQKVRHEHG